METTLQKDGRLPKANGRKPRRCVCENDVPYTNMKTGQTFWKREPCPCERMPGSKFCMLHHRNDYLPPETLAMRSNVKMSDSASIT